MSLLESFQFFSASYLATLAIAVACSYLGLFCVLRRIVFTGVALAQLAAAGVAAAFWLGADGKVGPTIGSLGATLGGALALELRPRRSSVPSDALVGLFYSAASALAILLVWRSAHGLAELRNILAGDVLLSREGELLSLWIGLAAVAAVHAAFRRPFLLVSFDPEFARSLRLPERAYQVLLMATLAVAVALSLRAAGLLLVFAFLVLPPVAGLALGKRLSESTWIALATSLGGSFAGFLVAILDNLPVAPTIACAMLVLLGLAWLGTLHPLAGKLSKLALAALAGTALLAALSSTLPSSRTTAPPPAPSPTPDVHGHEHEEHAAAGDDPLDSRPVAELVTILGEDPDPTRRIGAAEHLEDLADPEALAGLVAALGDEVVGVRDAAGAAIACLAAQPGVRERLHDDLVAAGPEQRVLTAFALVRLGELRGLEALVGALADEEVPVFLKERVIDRLAAINGGDRLGYDPFADGGDAALGAWKAWWERAGARLHWDAGTGRFLPP